MANISVDFYGNLDKFSDFWKIFMKYAILEGYKISIIGGNWENDLKSHLEELGYKPDIHYNEVFSILGFLCGFGFEVWLDEARDEWRSEDIAWWASKAHICNDQKIAIHFDNDIRFAKYFTDIPTRFVNTESNKGETILKNWKNQMEMANTFCNDDEEPWDIYGIGGVVPM